MRRSLMIASLMGCTALTPRPAHAGPVFSFLSGFAAYFGATVALSTAAFAGYATASFLFGSVFGQLVLAIGLSAISAALAPRPNIISPSDRLVNFAQALTPMDSAFGRTRKGGPYAVSSFQVTKRHYGVILAAHEIDGIEEWYVDERLVEVGTHAEASDVITTEPYIDQSYYVAEYYDPQLEYMVPGYWKPGAAAVSLRPHLGAAGQVADAQLVAEIPEWTAAHDMAGLAYVAAWAKRVKDERFQEVYGNSAPTGPVITPVIRGAKVYDPRTDTTAYSNNAALVWAWITTERLGQAVDWDHVAAEADACDVLVTNKQGSQQRKWTLNGSFSDNTDYESLRAQIIAGCDGYMFERPNGTLGLRVGRYIEPTITLTEDDFFSLSIAEHEWGPDAPTEFTGKYVEPELDWRESSTATFISDSEAVPVRREVSLFFVDSHNQAMRVLKRVAKSTRAQYSLRGQIRAIGYELNNDGNGNAHRFVRIQAHGFDFVADIGKLSRGEGSLTFNIEALSCTEADYDFVAATEEGDRPTREPSTSDNSVPVVTGLAGSAIDGAAIVWTWDSLFAASMDVELQYRILGSPAWLPKLSLPSGATTATTSGLIDGETYEAQVRHVTSARRTSTWSASVTVKAIANSVAPMALASFTAAKVAGNGKIDWQNANDPNHYAARLYRADYAPAYAGPFAIGSASLINTSYGAPNAEQSVTDLALATGVHAYWAIPINSSGIEGPVSGPQTFEII